MRVIVGKDYDEMSKKAAEVFAKAMKSAKVLGLATGGTPEGMYKELAAMNQKGEISFQEMKSVNLDEYIGLPEGHKESYRYFMNDKLFDHVDIDKEKTHVPHAKDKNDDAACVEYDQLIDSLGGVDLQVLGVGVNGHIAFNEPDNELNYNTSIIKLTDSTIDANARFFDKREDVPTYAISMGVGKIMEAKEILLLANGKKKAEAIRQLLKGDKITTACPVTLLKLHPNVTVVIDEELEGAL
ncbi:MAG: glucosamine-6-phosphate deaminase [Tissierellia bacterium]|nr:glucosamine-6-phosphate deaminase [Tissierellia bacterium]